MNNEFEQALKHLKTGLSDLEKKMNELPGNVGAKIAPAMADFAKVKDSLKTGDTTGLTEIITKYANHNK